MKLCRPKVFKLICVCEKVKIVLKTSLHDNNCSIHLPGLLSCDSKVLSYQAVISQTKTMTNKGDFVKATAAEVCHCNYDPMITLFL